LPFETTTTPYSQNTKKQVPNEAAACFRDRFAGWAARGPVRVVVTTRGFGDAFDGDELLVYDPDTTAAVILSECAAVSVCVVCVVLFLLGYKCPVYSASLTIKKLYTTLKNKAGGDAEAEAAARAVCADAEIATIASDAAPAEPPVYLAATPQSFQRWAAKHPASASASAAAQSDEDADAEEADAAARGGDGKVAFR
jgi:hypothetical protein